MDINLIEELYEFFDNAEELMTDFLRLFIDEEYLSPTNYRHEEIYHEDTREDEFYYLWDDEPPKANPLKYPACVGCLNYHGHTYNGNLLICAMHPYGWIDNDCPDREE